MIVFSGCVNIMIEVSLVVWNIPTKWKWACLNSATAHPHTCPATSHPPGVLPIDPNSYRDTPHDIQITTAVYLAFVVPAVAIRLFTAKGYILTRFQAEGCEPNKLRFTAHITKHYRSPTSSSCKSPTCLPPKLPKFDPTPSQLSCVAIVGPMNYAYATYRIS